MSAEWDGWVSHSSPLLCKAAAPSCPIVLPWDVLGIPSPSSLKYTHGIFKVSPRQWQQPLCWTKARVQCPFQKNHIRNFISCLPLLLICEQFFCILTVNFSVHLKKLPTQAKIYRREIKFHWFLSWSNASDSSFSLERHGILISHGTGSTCYKCQNSSHHLQVRVRCHS